MEEIPIVEERKIIWVCLSVIERGRGLFMCLSLRVKCVGEKRQKVCLCVFMSVCLRKCVFVFVRMMECVRERVRQRMREESERVVMIVMIVGVVCGL